MQIKKGNFMMKSKLLYGLLLSSMFISIDATSAKADSKSHTNSKTSKTRTVTGTAIKSSTGHGVNEDTIEIDSISHSSSGANGSRTVSTTKKSDSSPDVSMVSLPTRTVTKSDASGSESRTVTPGQGVTFTKTSTDGTTTSQTITQADVEIYQKLI